MFLIQLLFLLVEVGNVFIVLLLQIFVRFSQVGLQFLHFRQLLLVYVFLLHKFKLACVQELLSLLNLRLQVKHGVIKVLGLGLQVGNLLLVP